MVCEVSPAATLSDVEYLSSWGFSVVSRHDRPDIFLLEEFLKKSLKRTLLLLNVLINLYVDKCRLACNIVKYVINKLFCLNKGDRRIADLVFGFLCCGGLFGCCLFGWCLFCRTLFINCFFGFAVVCHDQYPSRWMWTVGDGASPGWRDFPLISHGGRLY